MAPPCLAIPFLAGVSDLNSEGRAGLLFPFYPQTDILFLHTCPVFKFGPQGQAN